MTTKADIGVMCLVAEEHDGCLATGMSQKSEPPEGTDPTETSISDLRLPNSDRHTFLFL